MGEPEHIECDPEAFRYILSFYRNGALPYSLPSWIVESIRRESVSLGVEAILDNLPEEDYPPLMSRDPSGGSREERRQSQQHASDQHHQSGGPASVSRKRQPASNLRRSMISMLSAHPQPTQPPWSSQQRSRSPNA